MAQPTSDSIVDVRGQEIERVASRFSAIIDRADLIALVQECATLVGPEHALDFASERLEARMALVQGRPGVLFLCVHNAGRSQMAAGWMSHLIRGETAVYSGGSGPADRINPAAVEAMAEVGIEIGDQYPKPWTDDVLSAADTVVTMGCGDECPTVPGARRVDWQIADPAGSDVAAVRPIRDEIEKRVRELLAELAPERRRASARSGARL